MSTRRRNIFVYIIVMAAIAAIVLGIRNNRTESKGEITLWRLVDDINNEDVETLTISDDGKLKATYNDNVTRAVDVNTDEEQVYMLLEWYGADPDTLYSVEIESQANSSNRTGLVGWIFSGLLPLLLVGGFVYGIFRSKTTIPELGQSRARLYQPAIKFDDLGGMNEATAELRSLIDFLKAPERLVQQGVHLPHGVLLTGEPGTGKTLLARAAGREANGSFFEVGGPEFVELFVGVASSRIHDLFLQAEQQQQRTIVFIDELDTIGAYRGADDRDQTDERHQALSQLCLELDRLAPSSPILVIGATNRPDLLDPALLRSGRFERQIHLPRPDAAGRERILQIHARIRPLDSSVDLAQIALSTEGFVGSDLEHLVNQAAMISMQQQRSFIIHHDFELAIEHIRAIIHHN